ncbi:MAG: glycoside hydrolase family 25 [Lachnospiraceae bacterium]|nr:glycoside hydrolase family 25 [Lachnospiraceae bacterium]
MPDWDRRAYGGMKYREREENPREVHSRFRKKLITITIIVVALIFTCGTVVALLFMSSADEAEDQTVPEVVIEETEDPGTIEINEGTGSVISLDDDKAERTDPDAETENEQIQAEEADPQEAVSQTGEESDFSAVKNASSSENDSLTLGIDVAKYQGTIDWQKVSQAGVQFAMIRVGYRTMESGTIVEDVNARYNLQQAKANNIKIGVYFFSTAVTEMEAMEEAQFVLDMIAPYPITYPVAYNCEGFNNPDSRQYSLTKEKRTRIARAFLDRIFLQGYTPMFYAAKNELENEIEWETGVLEDEYKMWVAYYPSPPYPQTPSPGYGGQIAMWQYTGSGTVPGVPKGVDLDVAYFGYDEEAKAQSDEVLETASASAEALMNFKDVSEQVTAKDSTNLRDIPAQGEESRILYTLKNGETAERTGISDSGWSRISYNGQTCYAVSSFLTTDLSAKTEEPVLNETQDGGDGLKTVFAPADDLVTPKIEINLRTLPSVTNEESAIVATVPNGTILQRTGINADYGWSRVEYNGMTLYCVSSYLTAAQ